MPYKTSHIFGIFYTQIGAYKSAKIVTFAYSAFVLLLVCHIGMLVLNKNAKENLLLQFVSTLGENRYFDWTTRAE